METLKIYSGSINERHIERAVEVMRSGGIIIYPTDTLYAIGCDALNNRSIERLCGYKGINPQKQHLSVVCADLSQASEYARVDNRAFRVLKNYLPGPYTFILPAATTLPKVFKGRRSVGVRIPDNDIARALARAMGNPLLSTSVAVDDELYDPIEPESLAWHFSGIADLAIDGGEGGIVPSTVVDLSDPENPEVVRLGAGAFDL